LLIVCLTGQPELYHSEAACWAQQAAASRWTSGAAEAAATWEPGDPRGASAAAPRPRPSPQATVRGRVFPVSGR